jgi:hypothetical protein
MTPYKKIFKEQVTTDLMRTLEKLVTQMSKYGKNEPPYWKELTDVVDKFDPDFASALDYVLGGTKFNAETAERRLKIGLERAQERNGTEPRAAVDKAERDLSKFIGMSGPNGKK